MLPRPRRPRCPLRAPALVPARRCPSILSWQPRQLPACARSPGEQTFPAQKRRVEPILLHPENLKTLAPKLLNDSESRGAPYYRHGCRAPRRRCAPWGSPGPSA